MFNCLCNNSILSIDDYCINSKNNNSYPKAECPYCLNELVVKASNSKHKTHFSHKPKQSCSVKDYNSLFKSNGRKKTKDDINKFKKEIIKSSYNIFLQIKNNFIETLTIKEFLKTLEKVASPKILSLRGINCNHIPYIWLNETSKIENKIFLYTNSSKINFENNVFSEFKIWNTSEKKDIIIIVSENNNTILRDIKAIDLNFFKYYDNTIPLNFLSEISNEIFDMFHLDDAESQKLLKELLDNIQ